MTKTMLENLYNDALALMEGMRDYVQEDARQDRVALPWDKRDVIIQVNRLMVVRLCHALQLIEAHRARLAGDPQAGEPAANWSCAGSSGQSAHDLTEPVADTLPKSQPSV